MHDKCLHSCCSRLRICIVERQSAAVHLSVAKSLDGTTHTAIFCQIQHLQKALPVWCRRTTATVERQATLVKLRLSRRPTGHGRSGCRVAASSLLNQDQ